MKNYSIVVNLFWVNLLEGENEDDVREKIKEIYREAFNIELEDEEIVEIVEEENNDEK